MDVSKVTQNYESRWNVSISFSHISLFRVFNFVYVSPPAEIFNFTTKYK